MDKLPLIVLLAATLLDIGRFYSEGKCAISQGWQNMMMDERLLAANTVVYGKTIQHRSGSVETGNGAQRYMINAVFDVYCVLKLGSGVTVPENIFIENISPRDGCSGTKDHMQIGSEAIVSLKPAYDGKFEYDEVMPRLSATFPATIKNLLSISNICDLQAWNPPTGASQNRCPICGIGNFTNAVMATAIDDIDPCLFSGFFSQVNSSECIKNKGLSAEDTCIEADYTMTCTRLMFRWNPINCTCVLDKDTERKLEEVGGAPSHGALFTVVMATLFAILATFDF